MPWVPISIPNYLARLSGRIIGNLARKQINQVALCYFFEMPEEIQKYIIEEFIYSKEFIKINKKIKESSK